MARHSASKRGLLPANPLFRLLVIHGVAGAVLGVAFVAGLLVLDVAGIHSLLSRTGEWVVGLSLLTMGSITTFASVSMGGAIMMMPKEEEPREPPRRGLREPVPVMSAIPRRWRPKTGSSLRAD
ncbi:MAG: hypothetical protein J0L51_04825 [Rhizobiales bacterium]|nr:hypothetical protein [Hyphomicrobiales bacterium]